jgi:Hydrogen maturase F tetramerization domain/Hydrogen maturase F dimerization domain
MCLIVKERDLPSALNDLKRPPDLVITDSRVIQKVSADVPAEIALTTFSILMARQKGNLAVLAEGAAVIETLRPGDRVLIAEACSHHALEDDIGRVEIPRWLRQFVGGEVEIETFAGRDYPEHVRKAQEAGVPVTNCGMAISFLQGAIRRTLAPFPEALTA